MQKACEIFCGIRLPCHTKVGRRVRIEHFGGMVLAAVSIRSDEILRQNTTLGMAHKDQIEAKPVLENHADIGAGAVILGAVTVGYGAIVGAYAVITRDVPPFAVVGGVPARLIRKQKPILPLKATKKAPDQTGGGLFSTEPFDSLMAENLT